MWKTFALTILIPLFSFAFTEAGQQHFSPSNDSTPKSASIASTEGTPINVPVMEANMELYRSFVAEKGGDPLAIDSFVSSYSNRVVADMVLLQQALKLGGANVQLIFYGSPNPARAENDVKEGRSPILGYETWKSNFDHRVYSSDVIIKAGDFLKVIVGRLDNGHGLMKIRTLEELRKLTVVTGHRWDIDLMALREMGIKKIMTVPRYTLQIAMLQEKRADFGLYEYPNIIKEMPEGLGVVHGITVGMNESRHFMVSKLHPLGRSLYAKLQKGIAVLKSRKAFQKAYKECGFESSKLDAWKRIYP